MLIALRYNDRSRWLLFTEAKLFGLNGIIMHRGPCAALNVRKALDSSATRLPRRRRRPGCRRGAYQAACRRTARCAQDWIGAEQMAPPSQQHYCRRTAGRLRTTAGYPSEFSTKHITCDFSTTVCCLIVHCDAQKMITAIHTYVR